MRLVCLVTCSHTQFNTPALNNYAHFTIRSGTRPDFSGWSHYLDLVSSGEKERLDALVSAALGPDRHGDGDVGGKNFGGFGGRASGASCAAE